MLDLGVYKAGAKDIYKNDLNDSMDSILGRSFDISGVELSGGQWQKLAIARGLVGNPLFVVFDEPTSNLDPIAEYEQFVQIKEQLHGETILIVSHRLGLSRLANRIWVLKDGQLIEDGSHYELLSKNQEYARLWENQIKWYDLDLISKGGF
jgi:ATP-binding cassette subfamily B protein